MTALAYFGWIALMVIVWILLGLLGMMFTVYVIDKDDITVDHVLDPAIFAGPMIWGFLVVCFLQELKKKYPNTVLIKNRRKNDKKNESN